MKIIDTHTHLYAEAFDQDRAEMIERALALGVSHFFLPAIDSSYTDAMHALKNKYPKQVYLMMGLHPTHVKENHQEELDHVRSQLSEHNYCAVGEIGIDLHWDTSYIKEQIIAFEQQILWAKEKKLPIVIHCRDAFEEVFAVLEKHKDENLKGIFHCFTGTLSQAQRAIECGMKLGIGGVVTFKNGKIDRFLHQIPLTEIVLETDAPYLAPVPYRGKRNESAYIIEVVEKVAEVYQKTKEEIANVTTKNALAVFGVKI